MACSGRDGLVRTAADRVTADSMPTACLVRASSAVGFAPRFASARLAGLVAHAQRWLLKRRAP